MIPFVDLQHIHRPLLSKFQKVQDDCLTQSDFVTGKMVAKFEEEFAQYCETKFCIGVSSGTAALFLTLKALGIKAGDEVIVPAHTFIATAMAVSQCGATPVFVDADRQTWNTTSDKISDKISDKTKAIIVVHIYGNPVNMNPIMAEARKKSIPVIEDAAQAHGALYHEKKIGSLADVACFSFYPSKNLGALGEGGAVVTDNEELAKKIFQWRDYGRSDKYKHEFVGYNMRLQGIQAGFLSVKLPHLDHWNAERRRLMDIYQSELKDSGIVFQTVAEDAVPVYHLGVVQSEYREKIIQNLTENHIGYGIHYPIACHRQPAYPEHHQLSLPVSERLSQTVISLPLFVGLKDEQVKKVCRVLKISI